MKEQFMAWLEQQYPGFSLFFDDYYGNTWQESELYRHWVETAAGPGMGPEEWAKAYPTYEETMAGGLGSYPTIEAAYQESRAQNYGISIEEYAATIKGWYDFLAQKRGSMPSIAVTQSLKEEYFGDDWQLWSTLMDIGGAGSYTLPNIDLASLGVEIIWGDDGGRDEYYYKGQFIGETYQQAVDALKALGVLSSGYIPPEWPGYPELSARKPKPALNIPTPNWLPQLVPGLTAGAPLELRRGKVPSGQMWNRLSDTQRQMYGGYIEATSGLGGPQTFSDILTSLEQSLPRQRTGAARWQPAFQR